MNAGHPDFAATGLHHTSYVLYRSIYELYANELKGPKGELIGELRLEFRKAAGLP